MRVTCIIIAISSLFLIPNVQANSKQLESEAKSIIKRFAGQLKPKLKHTLQSKGPVEAIKVCAEYAPKIAAELSIETGWSIKRVSLKPRNSETAIADEWETKQLEHFSVNQNNNIAKIKTENEFRLMKAQRVEGICTTCHGSNIAPDILTAIKKHYPNDSAIGYEPGDVRGAFSLKYKF